MKQIRFLAIVLATAVLLGCTGDSYSWRQKLTLTVETPEGEKSASSVTAVSWRANKLFRDGAAFQATYKGEAVVLDLGGGRYLFALLSDSQRPEYIAQLAPSIFEQRAGLKWGPDVFNAVEKSKDRFDVPSSLQPMLVTFANIGDPASVNRVNPSSLGANFGAGYRLKSITLQVTDEAVTLGRVESVLRWLKKVGADRPTFLPNPPKFHKDAFDPGIQYLSSSSFSTELYK